MSEEKEVRVVDAEQQKVVLNVYRSLQDVVLGTSVFVGAFAAHQFESRMADLDDIVSVELDSRVLEAYQEELDEAQIDALLDQIAGTPFQSDYNEEDFSDDEE
jgi:hypothetical protein